jgi:hypothetical protein
MNHRTHELAVMTAEFESVLTKGAQQSNSDPLVIACLGLSNMTLDLVWALQWIDTLTDQLGTDGMVMEFMTDLEARCKTSRSLELAAKEVELL